MNTACLSIPPELWRTAGETMLGMAVLLIPIDLFWLMLERLGK